MVQEDTHFPISILLITERVLHLGLASVGAAGEVVISHGDSGVAVHVNLVVVEHDVRPAFATVDGKAGILLMTVRHRLVPNEVGHGISGCWPELGFDCLGRLEQHVGAAVAIELTSRFGSSCDIVTCG